VQVVQRWILARLRHRTFFSLAELNAAISELCDELNDRPMKTYGASRRELFERLDKPALRALPRERFVFGEWSTARVNIDYHVDVDGHYYSVPHGRAHDTRGERTVVDVRASAHTIEIYLRSERIASHLRSRERGRHTTCAEHMPLAHRAHADWSPSRIIKWADTIGPETTKLVTAILEERRHPEQGYRSCLGILRLSKTYGAERLEAACARAVAVRARSYRHVDAILKKGLDRVELPKSAENDTRVVTHANVRGPGYYH
jgi:transposase